MLKLQKHIFDLWNSSEVKLAIKVALSAFISFSFIIAINDYFHRPEIFSTGLWAVLAAIVVIQPNLGATYKAMWLRFLGLIVGSFIGTLFAELFGVDVLLVAFAIFMTVMICSWLKLGDSYRIAALAVVSIMIPWKLNSSYPPWVYAINRFFDTTVGLSTAGIVAHFFWPSQALTKMRDKLSETILLIRQYFQYTISLSDLPQSDEISKDLFKEVDKTFLSNYLIFEESKIELLVEFKSGSVWGELLRAMYRLWESVQNVHEVYSHSLEEVFDDILAGEVKDIFVRCDLLMKELAVKIKTSQSSADFTVVPDLLMRLNRELVRFRSTRKTRRYNIETVECYFVFFHALRNLLVEIQSMHEVLDKIDE